MAKRLTMTIPEAGKQLGVGRNQAYQAAKAGQIPTIRIGKRLLVPVSALENKLLSASDSAAKDPEQR
jgi:excisionase family DNA binding protein